jgi:hypothetical protein
VSDPFLLQVVAAIGAGNLKIGPIHDDEELVHGCLAEKTGEITINPAVSVVDTAVHEAIHRMRPKWSENTVRQRTGKIMRKLSHEEVDTLYTIVLSVGKTRKTAKRI